MALLTIDIAKIEHNASLICREAAKADVSIYGVTKVLCGIPDVARAMLRGGVKAIADSRSENIATMRKADIPGPFVLLRLPNRSLARQVVTLSDMSLNSEYATCVSLSEAATAHGVTHGIILMVDLGDLREGVWPNAFMSLVKSVCSLPSLEIRGIGTNLTCYGGIVPDKDNLGVLHQLALEASTYVGYKLEVSGGNSSTLPLLFQKQIPKGITNLRVGEGIVLGRETVNRSPLPGAYTDACLISAEIIELKEKPSVPLGTVGQDAFGNVPLFVDRGWRKRAILSLGRQDTVPEGLVPLLSGVDVIGASSDHLLMDITDCTQLAVGDIMTFGLSYGALLAAATSPYVEKRLV